MAGYNCFLGHEEDVFSEIRTLRGAETKWDHSRLGGWRTRGSSDERLRLGRWWLARGLVLAEVARRLREDGHDVYPVTLTGLGEQVHLASLRVDLETHITDVVNLIEFEDLRDVVLLGHSYANLVVTGVADRVVERISQLVYLDTGQLPNGTALIEVFPPEVREHIERQVDEFGDGWRFPLPPQEELANFGSLEGLDDAKLELLRSRAVSQPFGTFTQPLRLENPVRNAAQGGYCVQLLARRGAGYHREWRPRVPRDGEPELALYRTANGPLSGVLET